MEKVLALFATRAEADEAVEELLSLGYDEPSMGYALKLEEQHVSIELEDEDDEVLVEDIEAGELPLEDIDEYDFSIDDPDGERHQMEVEDLFVNREVAEIEELPEEAAADPATLSLAGAGHLGAAAVAVVPGLGRLFGAGTLAAVVEVIGGTVGRTVESGPESAIWAEWSGDEDGVPDWAETFRRGLDEGGVLISVATREGGGAGLAAILEEAGASQVGVFAEP